MTEILRWRGFGSRISPTIRPTLLGGAAVAILTAICRGVHASFSITSFLFLLVILLQSSSGNFPSTVLVSIAAVASLDYYFVEPLYSFDITHGLDIAALASFLITALVVTRLVSRVRAESASARRQKERVELLYRLSQQLLPVDPHQAGGIDFLQVFLGAFGITAVCLFDGETAQAHLAGKTVHDLAQRIRDAYISGQDSDDRAAGVSMRQLHLLGKTGACIGFEGLEDAPLTAGPLAALAATVMERTRALEQASESAAAAQAEVYRSAILDALAHEFQTPLATILAAAGGLREAGPLGREQAELTEIVETEAARLGSLTSRLLRVARVDREEVKPQMESVDIVSLMEELVAQYVRRWPDLRVFLLKQVHSLEVQVDPHLLRLAVSQLLENACKYSRPGSTVSMQIQGLAQQVEIRVANRGSSIAVRDQQKIFERFYRGCDAALTTPGSGLGLYVARKIALAHGGSLELESDGLNGGEVRFCLMIPWTPVPKSEADHVATAS